MLIQQIVKCFCKMVRVIEYINKKRNMRDLKMGRWWRVPELKDKEREGKESS